MEIDYFNGTGTNGSEMFCSLVVVVQTFVDISDRCPKKKKLCVGEKFVSKLDALKGKKTSLCYFVDVSLNSFLAIIFLLLKNIVFLRSTLP